MNQILSFTMLDNIEIPVLACDCNGRFIYLNKKAKELTGTWLLETTLHHSVEIYGGLLKEDGSKVNFDDYPLMRALRGETVQNEVFLVRTPHKMPIYFQLHAKPLIAEGGELLGAMSTFRDVTESYNETKKLQIRFQSVFDRAPLSIQVFDKQGNTVYMNPAFKKLWALNDESMSQISGKYNILADLLLEKLGLLTHLRKAFAGEVSELPPIYYDPTDIGLKGEPRHTRGLAFPLKGESGDFEEVVLFHFDVTEQYKATRERDIVLEELHIEKNKFEAILKQMPAGVLVAEPSGKILIRNEQLASIFGQDFGKRNRLGDLNYMEFYKADGKPYSMADWPIQRSLFSGETVFQEEVKSLTENGKAKIINVTSNPVHDSAGNIVAGVAVMTDITEKKRIESRDKFLSDVKALLMATLDYDQVLEKIASACVPHHSDGCLVDILRDDGTIHRIISRHFDNKHEKLMRGLHDQLPVNLNSRRPCARVIKSGEPLLITNNSDVSVAKYTDTKEHSDLISEFSWNCILTAPMIIRGKTIGAITFFNTSKRANFDDFDLNTSLEIGRRAATALENARLYLELQKSIKLRDEFISVASHELKTPITTLNLQLEVLADTITEKDNSNFPLAQSALISTKRQLDRLQRLVDDMLDITSIDSGKLRFHGKKVQLSKLIKDVSDRFEGQLKNLKVELGLNIAPSVEVFCDPYRIEQVITNLITNAIKYGERKPIMVTLKTENDLAVLQVQDQGRGIAKADQERIFERFERAIDSDEVIGLGLGLFISRRIVEEMSGNIYVESEPNRGSTFIVELPLT